MVVCQSEFRRDKKKTEEKISKDVEQVPVKSAKLQYERMCVL